MKPFILAILEGGPHTTAEIHRQLDAQGIHTTPRHIRTALADLKYEDGIEIVALDGSNGYRPGHYLDPSEEIILEAMRERAIAFQEAKEELERVERLRFKHMLPRPTRTEQLDLGFVAQARA